MKKSNIVLIILLLLYPMAIIPKEVFFLFSVCILIYLIINNEINLKNKYFQLFLFLFLTHIISSCLYLFLNSDAEISRLLAAFNTAFSWGEIGFLMATSFKFCDNDFMIKAKRVSFLNLMIIFVLSIIAIYLEKKGINLQIFGKNLYIDDWTSNGKGVRLILFFEYSSLITFFILINTAIYINKTLCFKNVIVMIIMLFPIWQSKSRICFLSYFILIILYIIFWCKYRIRNYKIIGSIIIFTLIFFFIFNFTSTISIFNKIFNMRSSSNLRRFEIYKYSILKTIKYNPIIGCGIKVEYVDNIPYGSHSSFIGLFYKLGFVGITIGFLLVYYIVCDVKKTKNPILFMILFCFFIIMIFEDLDGTNWVLFYSFLMLRLLLDFNDKN